MSTFKHTHDSNIWYNKRIRKSIDERRETGKYYKRKCQNKAKKKKQFKNKERRKTRGENETIIWNEWYDNFDFSDDDYSSDRNKYLSELARSLLPYFDFCFNNFGIDPDTNSRIDSLSYDAYLEMVPPEMQFSANKEKFKPILFEILHDMFYNKYLDILHSDDDHTLFYEMYQNLILIRYNESVCSCCHEDYCYHCKLCQDKKIYGMHYVWDIFCHDMKSYIYEIKLEIELMQLKDIDIITQFNEMNSKQKWAQYMSEMINIHGISTNLCFIILDFVSHEYPQFFWYINNDRNNEHDTEEEYENYPTKQEAERFIEKSRWWFRNKWIKKIHGSSIGIYYYNEHDHGYFYVKSYQMVEYSTNWLDLWNNIGNMSIQIDCYKSMNDIINNQIIEGKSIYDIMAEKREKNKKESIRLKQQIINQKYLALQKQTKRTESFIINMEIRCSSTIPSEKERRKYDHKIRAERKYLTHRVRKEIEKIKENYRISDQKKVYKRENGIRKYEHKQMKLLRDKFRTLRVLANRYVVCYGYVHQFESEYNNCVELIIPTDVIQVILHYITV